MSWALRPGVSLWHHKDDKGGLSSEDSVWHLLELENSCVLVNGQINKGAHESLGATGGGKSRRTEP